MNTREILKSAEYIHRGDDFFIKINDKLYTVNQTLHDLLKSISEGKTIREIFVNENVDINVIQKKIDFFLNNVLEKKDSNNSYIKNAKTLVDDRKSIAISNIFKFLFYKKFPFFFGLVILSNFFIFSFSGNIKNYTYFNFDFLINTVIVYPIFFISIFIHEIGHISACKSFNINPKRIGCGFYFVFPVLFSDVTDIWLLKKSEKVIVNLGGVYFQLIFNLIIYGFSIFSGGKIHDILLHIFYINCISSVISLTPFFRGDGYWIYSDLFEIKNLQEKSDLFFKNVVKNNINKPISISIVIFTVINWLYRSIIVIILIRLVIVKVRFVYESNYLYNKDLLVSIFWIIICLIGIYKAIKSIYVLFYKKKINQNSF